MGELSTFRDAYGQQATIKDERRGLRPFRLKVYEPSGHCSHNATYGTYRDARRALDSLGYCWSKTRPAEVYTWF